jgi:protein-disulfide isomerase
MTKQRSAAAGPYRPLCLVAALAAAALLQLAPTPALAQVPEDREALLRKAALARAKGKADAPVLVYEVADFQCPYCGDFARDIMPRLDSAFVRTGRVQWVFVNLPLPSHRNAWTAAEAALCAGGVGNRFWPFHARLFEQQAEWADAADAAPIMARYARELGVPTGAFRTCVATDRVAPLILEDVIFAITSRVGGTPTFIINRDQVVVGMKTFEEWQEIIEAAARRPRP